MRIRRRGRHTAPSQIEKVAGKAGKAAPAVAITGALVAAPQAQQAVAATARPAAASAAMTAQLTAARTTAARTTAARTAANAAADRSYTVRAGDTLSGIAERFYHQAADWQWLYHVNSKTLTSPDAIYPGQVISIPLDPPAHYTLAGYRPRHAKPATSPASGGPASRAATIMTTASTGAVRASSASGSATLSGTLSCSGLEQLWKQAGGSSAKAFTAAEIAMAESGGRQYALSPTHDYGYWQINVSNGALATFNALGNARSAVILSHNGTNWSPWTTYTSGAYVGRC